MTLLYSIPDCCRLLSIGRTTVYGLLQSGQLEKVKIGRRTLVTRKSALALAGLLENQEGNGC
ncbi:MULTISPECIES: helix-turn-helix domain-containing protein [Thalassospira]|uniref:helix-turn-helix domain-containing protein n=1 Tax=Thalassospira TaxID=168934 RepID=UPI000DED737F